MNTNHRSFRKFAVSCVFALLCCAFVWIAGNDDAAREHIAIAGTVKEHEVFGRRKSPTLHFKLNESELNFRVDPSLFRYAMKKALPAGFKRGASVTVLVMKEEFDNPDVPLLNQGLHIAWVHELKVDGIKTTASLHQEILSHGAFAEGRIDTTFIEREFTFSG